MKKWTIAFLALTATAGIWFRPGLAETSLKNPNIAREVSTALADTVEKVLPAVVVIRTEVNRYFVDRWTARYYRTQQPLGQGSGVIISKDGYIITNRHVVNDAEYVEVVLEDGRSFPASYVGSNEQTDIAVIKIEPPEGESFPTLEPADSDAVRVGEMVMAIGSPFSLSSTVTHGIISQKGRSTELLPIVDFIQTSAPINPGNSGGALVDVDGKLIGINTLIQTANPYVAGNVGIGFAVPSKTAMRVAEMLIKGENGDLPWMGIEMTLIRGRLGISRVFADSPADKAGLKPGDILKGVSGKPIQSLESIRGRVSLMRPGESLDLEIIRGAETMPLKVQLERMPVMQPYTR